MELVGLQHLQMTAVMPSLVIWKCQYFCMYVDECAQLNNAVLLKLYVGFVRSQRYYFCDICFIFQVYHQAVYVYIAVTHTKEVLLPGYLFWHMEEG